MRPRWMLLALSSTLWGLGAFGHPAQAQSTATLTVTAVKAAGLAPVDVIMVVNGVETEVEKMVSVAASDMPADVAANIAKAFGGRVTANGATVTLSNTGVGEGFSYTANDAIRAVLEIKTAMLPAPNEPLAQFAFQPNPENGQDTLVTAAGITAGFANGTPLVSFTASAGTSLSALATMLDFDSRARGVSYVDAGSDRCHRGCAGSKHAGRGRLRP